MPFQQRPQSVLSSVTRLSTYQQIQEQWGAILLRRGFAIAPILTIRNEQDYDNSVAQLNALIDEVGTNEAYPLYTLLDTLGLVIQSYEDNHFPIPDCDGREVLAYLMEEHVLNTSDLPEIGSSETLNNILEGTQPL